MSQLSLIAGFAFLTCATYSALSSSLFCVIYGLSPQELRNKPHIVEEIDTFLREGAAAAMPGAYLVDIFPWMLNLPRWLAPWKRFGEEHYTRNTALLKTLLNDARAKRVSLVVDYVLIHDSLTTT